MEHCTQCKAKIRCFSQGFFIQIRTVWKHMKTDGSHVFPDGGSYITRQKDVCFSFIAIWVHSHSAHSRGFGNASLQRASMAS